MLPVVEVQELLVVAVVSVLNFSDLELVTVVLEVCVDLLVVLVVTVVVDVDVLVLLPFFTQFS